MNEEVTNIKRYSESLSLRSSDGQATVYRKSKPVQAMKAATLNL